ncbi:MAG TPA: GNAT family N-acetyltransferase [Micromonosporaceae bacterium]|jgi:GNAT superfamily N-acetyltransferase
MTNVTDGTTIRRARAAEATSLGSLVADAFHHLPIAVSLSPDPGPRRSAMAGQFTMLIAHAIAYGDVEVVEADGDPVAVAVWLGPDEMPDIEDYDARLAEICGPLIGRFVELDELMHATHPADPHAYLAFLAVRADRQRRGLGSELLKSYHRGLDASGTPAYLEASSPRSRALYARHGFVDYAPPYGLDGEEQFWPMWREPH